MQISQVLFYVLLCTSLFALFLHSWVKKEDFEGLPDDPKERLPVLFYFSTATLSTIGYGDVYPKSLRARMAVVLYMLFAYVASVAGFMQVMKNSILSG